MSKLFYDHLIRFEKIESFINSSTISHEEKLELWELIDGIAHYRIIHRILEVLPENHHAVFMQKFEQTPFDPEILDFLNSESGINIIEEIEKESGLISEELLLLLSSADAKIKPRKKNKKPGKRS